MRSELAELAMEGTRFAVRFEPADPVEAERAGTLGEHGLEQAEFLLSPNPGEDLRPLARIASGGELSRILLALKSAAAGGQAGGTLVFDEIDAGISGRVADVVGRKLQAMARVNQVLCVTHLPQIASCAEVHYSVRKRVESGRTLTEARVLDPAERVEEIARLVAGEVVTDAARHHARSLLQGARRP